MKKPHTTFMSLMEIIVDILIDCNDNVEAVTVKIHMEQ